jgi:hypothetical protein
MAYRIEKGSGDIVITGFENGIADSPYEGISDMRNINIISIPKEGSVNFSTEAIVPAKVSRTVLSADSATDVVTINSIVGIENYVAVTFTGGSLPGGIVAGDVYWVGDVSGSTFKLYTDYNQTSVLDITSTGTGTVTVYTIVSSPKYFAYDPFGVPASGIPAHNFLIDYQGKVWSDYYITPSGYWTYTGNKINNYSGGNGLVYYKSSNNEGYVFAFSASSIDYFTISTGVWSYQWDVSAGSVGVWSATPTSILKSGVLSSPSHEALVAPDNKVYFCDANWIGRWYQSDSTTPFVPTTKSTYTFDQTAILPFTDTANCISVLGNTLLVGGSKNVVYPWDTFSDLPSYPIFVAENNIVKLVTVNTNTFIFAGNRGRIYVTNGSQAQLYKKVPDHISGTVEPYFAWGGATSNKNQLYFSMLVTTNAGATVSQYGGVWAIDLDTKAIRLSNKLSYGTYAGYATAITPNLSSNPGGAGLFIGWYDGVGVVGGTGFGLDTTISDPYFSGEAIIDSDLIPIGTFLQPTNHGRVEFKLAVPLVSGESVQLKYRQSFSDSFTAVGPAIIFNTNGTGKTFSYSYQNVPFENSQWIQIEAVLTSTSVTPSFCRLTELRLGN